MSAVITWSFLIGVGALILATSSAGAGLAEEPAATPKLSLEIGEGKSYCHARFGAVEWRTDDATGR